MVYCTVPPELHTIEDTLVSLISSISSPYLISINITMVIAEEISEVQPQIASGDERGGSIESAHDLSAFHTFLDTSFSLNQDMVSTVFRVPTSKSTHAAVLRFKALISSRLRAVFAPWVKCGILYFRMDPISRTGEDVGDDECPAYTEDDVGKLRPQFVVRCQPANQLVHSQILHRKRLNSYCSYRLP